nr:hypothetical protein [Kibdelosporangium sp. MJ126-NF4]
MGLRNSLDRLRAGDDTSRMFGEPVHQPDGTTLVPVARVRVGVRISATPVGMFVVRDGHAEWVPAVDHTRIALFGELIGLVAATLASLAVLHRPPWPDLSRRPRSR